MRMSQTQKILKPARTGTDSESEEVESLHEINM